ncbi:MAG: DUF2784 family protein [Planctomycetaceae bacterium]
MSLQLLNLAFFVGHDALIAFNLVGWIWKRTRRLHRVTIAATLFSWLVMGAWYGWGYCLCTDWHFRIRRELGIHGGESSYTQLLLNSLPGVSVSRWTANVITVAALLLILIAMTVVRVFEDRKSVSRDQTPSA